MAENLDITRLHRNFLSKVSQLIFVVTFSGNTFNTIITLNVVTKFVLENSSAGCSGVGAGGGVH